MLHRRLREVSCRAWARLGVTVCVPLLAGTPAQAGLVISAPTGVAAVQGTSDPVNFFDVHLTADTDSPTGPFDINGFNVELRVSAASGITFTRVTTETAAPYLFASIATLGFDFIVSDGGTVIDFSDFGVSQADVKSVSVGDTFGLGRVYFDVSASAPVSPPVVVVMIDPASDVVDPDGTSFAPALADGSIRIIASAVPEPSSLVLGGLGALLWTAAVCLRGQRRSHQGGRVLDGEGPGRLVNEGKWPVPIGTA